MKATDLRDALLDVTEKVYHYRAPTRQAGQRYIVWGETGGHIALAADDAPQALTLTGELILYTQTEYDPTVNDLIAALNELAADDEFAWQIGGMGYDETGQFYQYVITWSMICGDCEVYQRPDV